MLDEGVTPDPSATDTLPTGTGRFALEGLSAGRTEHGEGNSQQHGDEHKDQGDDSKAFEPNDKSEMGQEDANGNSRKEGGAAGDDVQKDRETEEDNDQGDHKKEDPSSGETKGKDSEEQPEMSKDGRFEGTVDIILTGSIKQTLAVQFDLRITPAPDLGRYTTCTVRLDNLVVTAARMEDSANEEQDHLHFLVTNSVSIAVGSSGQHHPSLESVYPRSRHFVSKITDTQSLGGEVSVELSAAPKGTVKAVYGESHARELPPVAIEVLPLFIGSGRPGEHLWRYAPQNFSCATRIEFSEDNPPTHKAIYRLDNQSGRPTDMKMSIKTIFSRHGRLQRPPSSLPARIRFLADRKTKHFLLTLEARIGSDGEDFFEFPTQRKEGCKLWMEMDMTKSKHWESKPELRSAGAVASKLESSRIRKRELLSP